MRRILMIAAAVGACLAAAQEQPPEKPAWLTLGPYLQFTRPGTAVLRWHSAEPMALGAAYHVSGEARQAEEAAPVLEHAVTLTGLEHNAVHSYFIQGPDGTNSGRYECETEFNYAVPGLPEADWPGPGPSAGAGQAAQRVLEESGVTRGYALILGAVTSPLAYELARRSELRVIGFDTDSDAVAQARQALVQIHAYGPRVTIQHVASYAALPVNRYCANLVLALQPVENAEVVRVLRPSGGVALLPPPEESTIEGRIAAYAEGRWTRLDQGPLEGAGAWTHQYGSPDNSAQSHDGLLSATRTEQLEAQWVGQPGPRAMVDRNPRTPAPLYADGRLFVQGMHRIITLDAYNGAVLWSLEIPDFQRFNMPRDCGNWCTDGRSVIAAVKNACWRIDAATGLLGRVYPVPAPDGAKCDWAYVASVGETLFGSVTMAGTAYTNFRGKSPLGWYDAPVGSVTYKIGSDALFALSKESGQLLWRHEDGVILNSTITIAEGAVYFAECRNPEVKARSSRRLAPEGLWDDLWLVSLDAATGGKRWEQSLSGIAKGIVVFYLLHADNTLVLASSRDQYFLYAFDPATGARKWEAHHPWTNEDHGGHMQHPVAAGGTVYLEPCGYELATGKCVTEKVGAHGGCATYAATQGALVYRGDGGCVALWDTRDGAVTLWPRLRPSCWLSTIAGGGMVLSPEGGGGCSCGGWMETSIGFMRKER